jgi:GNAT superfamily N-acetyltransferase
MNQRELAALVEYSEARAYAALVRGRAPGGDGAGFDAVRLGSAWAIVSSAVTTSLNLNRVIGLGLHEPATELVVDEAVRTYSKSGLNFAIELSPCARPTELPNWLRQRRIRRSMPSAMHYRLAAPMTAEAAGSVVTRADSARDSDRVAEICCAVFRMPTAVRDLLSRTRHDERWRRWLFWIGREPVAAALSFVDEKVAWLGWDATLPQHRQHGAHRALIAARINDAYEGGCHHVTAETAVHTPSALNPSCRNYEKLGFLRAYDRWTYVSIRS